MTYSEAVAVLDMQDRKIKKIDGTRFEHDGYEYRLKYEGGFTCFVAIERRRVGKRNFKYYKGFGAFGCWTVGDVMGKVWERI